MYSVATLSIHQFKKSQLKLEAQNLEEVDDNIRGGQPAQS